MLGAGAVAIVLWLTTFGGDSSSDTDLFDLGLADFIGGQSWIFIIVAVAFLAMVWWLDEHGYQAVGTSLVVAALLSAALAVLKVVQDLGSSGGALLLTFAGVVVAVVGDHGQRRATHGSVSRSQQSARLRSSPPCSSRAAPRNRQRR